MKTYTAVVERCPDTGMYVGYVPGFPGAHTQAESLDELNANLREVIGMLLEEGEPGLEAEFVGTQTVKLLLYWKPSGASKFGNAGLISSTDILMADSQLFRFIKVATSPLFCYGRSSRISVSQLKNS